MEKILVPVDFSKTSRNALLYAVNLSEFFNAEIKVIHVFSSAVPTVDPLIVQQLPEKREINEKNLETFLKSAFEEFEVSGKKTPEITTEVIDGITEVEIIQQSEYEDIILIVMGTTGSSNIEKKIFGSISINVAKKAYCPVVLVPKDVAYEKIAKIMYASNYEGAVSSMIEKLTGFAQHFKADIHFVHVCVSDDDKFEEIERKIFDNLFEAGEPPFSFTMKKVNSETVSEGLNRYAIENEIDMIVMVSKQRSFLENLIHRSKTKRMAMNTRLPLVVFHLGD